MQASSDAIMEISESEVAAEEATNPSPNPDTASESPESPTIGSTEEDGGDPAPKLDDAITGQSEEPEEDSDSDDEGEEESEEEPEEESEDESTGEEEDEVTFEGTDGEKYSGNIKIKKKIDGKWREVSLKDALNEYTGRFPVKERFAEANKIKQKAEHQTRQVEVRATQLKKTASRFIDAMSEGNTREALDVLCEFTGHDSDKMWDQVVQTQREHALQLAQMSQEEYDRYQAKVDAEYYSSKKDRLKEDNAESNLLERKIKAQEEHGLSDDELKWSTEFLLDMQKKGVYNQDLTLDDVVSTALDKRIWEGIDSTVREVLPEKSGDNDFYNGIFNDTKEHGLTKDDWISILKEIKNKKQGAAKLQKKVEANKSPTKSRKSPKSKPSDTELLDIIPGELDDI